jgi:hypothetical protein
MTHEAPTIVKLTERVLVEIEIAVRGFPRYHKYTSGTRLRDKAHDVAVAAHRAWRDMDRRQEWTSRLVFAVDDLKLEMQISKSVQAFKSFAQFEALIRLVSDLGKQCGGWKKQQHPKGQNHGALLPSERAQILSARDTSQGVNL